MSEIVMRSTAHDVNRRIQKEFEAAPKPPTDASEARTLMFEIAMRLKRIA